MLVCWWRNEIGMYLCNDETVVEHRDIYLLVPPECVLFEIQYEEAQALDLRTNDVLTADTLYELLIRENGLFWYKYSVYCKLRNKGWVIRDAYDVGADYYLYATEVELSHSLHIVSIDYGSYASSIIEGNSTVIRSLSQSPTNHPSLSGFTSTSIGSIPLPLSKKPSLQPTSKGNHPFLWTTVQRMSRLANSMKKTWLIVALQGEIAGLNSPTLPSISSLDQIGTISLLQINHWSPISSTKDHKLKVIKK